MSRRKRRLSSRIRGCLRNILAFLFTNVGVIVLVVGYTIAGAFMFQAIEGAGDAERVNLMSAERNSTVHYLWQNVTLIFNNFNDTALKERIGIEIHQYQKKIVVAVRKGWDGGRSSRQWTFSSAFLYSLTVITTIGYGHLSPRTSWGKVTTIFYALLGMPLFLLYLSNLGTLLAQWFKCIYALVCLCRGCPGFNRRRVIRLRMQTDASDSESIERPIEWRSRYIEPEFTTHYGAPLQRNLRRADLRSQSLPYPRGLSPDISEYSFITFNSESVTVPISVCVSIMVGYIVFGSMLFGMWEKWDKLDGAYFCFISLSSIGFGDFVPGERVYSPRIDTSFIACSLYLLLGMALIAMCFNLMQEQVIHYFTGAKRALKRICRCKR